MAHFSLSEAVEVFSAAVQDAADVELERAWAWQDYDSEGVRYACFRTYEELGEFEVWLGAARMAAGKPQTPAQHALAIYHRSYRDLQALLAGAGEELAFQEPAPGEWPLRQVLLHIIQTERAFFAISAYALQGFRAQDERPLEMPDEDWERFWEGDAFSQLKESGSLAEIRAYEDSLHARILGEFSSLTGEELQAPSIFWESQPYPILFRLLRFNSHLQQHTIQVEKTLAGLGLRPNEARRIQRRLFAALAGVEGLQLGAGELGAGQVRELAARIRQRAGEISLILAKG